MARPELDALPAWPPGTVAVLSTGGGDAPHAIPVSTALAAGPRTLVLVLARRRESLARLRAAPQVALTVLAAGDVAFTAHGEAHVLEEDLGPVVAVRVDVARIQDHNADDFAIEAGVRWGWTDAEASRRDERVRAALARIAAAS